MHIEPGVVDGAKLILSYATAAGASGLAAKMAWDTIKRDGLASFGMRAAISTVAVFIFFEVFFKYPVGVSEVHLILGATLYLVLGAGPAAIGLALGLLSQGVFFAPADLPQYAMNVTTLIVPLWAVAELAKRIIPAGTAYVDLRYRDVLALSAMYQGGVIAWVAFWALYGQGFGAENLANISSFAMAYALVIVLEPLIDLAVLAGAKALGDVSRDNPWLNARLHHAAA
ncbi:MAG: energy-coupling factor ABC transporter permease [Devosiaceae bacterium]